MRGRISVKFKALAILVCASAASGEYLASQFVPKFFTKKAPAPMSEPVSQANQVVAPQAAATPIIIEEPAPITQSQYYSRPISVTGEGITVRAVPTVTVTADGQIIKKPISNISPSEIESIKNLLPVQDHYMVTATSLHMRKAPDAQAEIVQTLTQDSCVTKVEGGLQSFMKIAATDDNGQNHTGYVHMDYVTPTANQGRCVAKLAL